MTQPVKKTDTHSVTQVLTGGAGSPPVHGINIFSIVNRQTGEEVDRVEGYTAALAAQKAYDAKVKNTGQ